MIFPGQAGHMQDVAVPAAEAGAWAVLGDASLSSQGTLRLSLFTFRCDICVPAGNFHQATRLEHGLVGYRRLCSSVTCENVTLL